MHSNGIQSAADADVAAAAEAWRSVWVYPDTVLWEFFYRVQIPAESIILQNNRLPFVFFWSPKMKFFLFTFKMDTKTEKYS